jgi:hypothetical protein
MRNLLPDKERHYNVFADAVQKKFMQVRFGVKSCANQQDLDLAYMRKELVDWQQNDDAGALCQVSINYSTNLETIYDHDTTTPAVDFDKLKGGTGSVVAGGSSTPSSFQINYNNNGLPTAANIVDVQTAGCITRINLNPSITLTGATFTFTQDTPADEWVIQHDLGYIPNVFTRDDEGVAMEGIVTPIDKTLTIINFSVPVAGTAYLS